MTALTVLTAFFFFSQRAAFVVEPNIDRHAAVSNYTEL